MLREMMRMIGQKKPSCNGDVDSMARSKISWKEGRWKKISVPVACIL